MRHDRGNGAWAPILTESLRDEAVACVIEIAEALRASPVGNSSANQAAAAAVLQNPTLGGGAAGVSLFYAYLARGLGDLQWEADAIAYLEQAMVEAPGLMNSVSLYDGLPGVGWTYSHLQSRRDPENDDAVTDVDELLLQQLRHPDHRGECFDLINGLAGAATYALQRLPSANAKEILSLVVTRLANQAAVMERGVCWHTSPALLGAQERSRYAEGYYNLGVAHGQPGVIAVLGAICRAEIRLDLARPLLDGAVDWLLQQQLTEEDPSVFGAQVTAGETPKPARSAWCYGDPGVAATLLVAARSVGQPLWEAEALRIARKAAMRDPDDAGVKDTCLCHGAAGLGHLFNRLYHATGDSDCLRAAHYWFTRTLEMRIPNRGIAGFCNYGPDRLTMEVKLLDEPGFLMGVAGIGLALLAAVTPLEPSWDSVMAISIPGPVDHVGKEATHG